MKFHNMITHDQITSRMKDDRRYRKINYMYIGDKDDLESWPNSAYNTSVKYDMVQMEFIPKNS